jgi:hypothetical protein
LRQHENPEAMTAPSTPSTARTYRQRSTQLLAYVFIAAAAFLILSLLRSWAANPSPGFLSLLVLGIAVSWVLFLRPAVVVDREGVTLRNLVRDVFVPWHLLTDVEARWNVRVFAGEKGYSAWAVSKGDRPKPAGGGVLGGFGQSTLARYSAEDTAGAPEPGGSKVTSRLVADVIEDTKAEYAAAVAQGEITPPESPAVQVRWAVPALVALAVPAVAVLAFLVL